MRFSIIYSKSSVFIIYDREENLIYKIGFNKSINREIRLLDSIGEHINVVKMINLHSEVTNSNLIEIRNDLDSLNENWMVKLNQLIKTEGDDFDFYVTEKLYSNLLKHPNNITVCGSVKITGIDYAECYMIKLSFLFQMIMVIKFLNIEENICHGDLSERNIWFKETDDSVLVYDNYMINSHGFLVQIGDFGESYNANKGRDKCNDLYFVVGKMINQLKFYHSNCDNFIMYDISLLDNFLEIFNAGKNSDSNFIPLDCFNALLDHDIFSVIVL